MDQVDRCAALGQYITSCQAALAAGEFEQARVIALEMLERARNLGCALREAEAIFHLGAYFVQSAKYAEACDWMKEAASRFTQSGHLVGEARALSVLASAYSFLGCYEEAIEAARRAQVVAGTLHDRKPRIAVNHNAGIVHMLAGSFDIAASCFQIAEDLANGDLDQKALLSVAVAQSHLSVTRACFDRDVNGGQVSLTEVESQLAKCKAVLATAADGNLSLKAKAHGVIAMAANILGDHHQALEAIEQAETMLVQPSGIDLRTKGALAKAEALLGLGRLTEADHVSGEALRLAREWKNSYMLASVHRLRAIVYEAMERTKEALAEEREFRRAQQAEMQKRTAHLARAVEWRTALAQKTNALAQVELDSRRLEAERANLERLALQDPLTGLRNRRFLDDFLRRQLDAGADLMVALIDVDRFKSINDNFSHRVGDGVLVGIANAMTACLRETDFAVRLAGDEFVIVMPGANEGSAEVLRQRLKDAVRNRDWSSVAPGLVDVSISIGLAQAKPGDSVESLVEAADREMYTDKRATKAAARTTDGMRSC